MRDHEVTRRAELFTYRAIEIDKIRGAERLLTQYFEHSFSERADMIKNLFSRLDEAVERGDDNTVKATLTGIATSPRPPPWQRPAISRRFALLWTIQTTPGSSSWLAAGGEGRKVP